jgi:hypothetical protein
MRKFPLIAAVARAVWALPAYAGDGRNAITSQPDVSLAQLALCVGPNCGDRDRVHRERRYYGRDDVRLQPEEHAAAVALAVC